MFTNDPPPIVETISKEDDLLNPDKDLSDGGKTEASASEYEGDLKDMPYEMLFGLKECRVKFTQPIDKGTFIRVCGNGYRLKECHVKYTQPIDKGTFICVCVCVCGNRYGNCPRPGHNMVAKDRRGHECFCKLAWNIKDLDGKCNAFQSKEGRNVKLLKEREIHEKGLLEAASFFKGISTSPLSSEEAAYHVATLGDKKGAFEDLYSMVDKAIMIDKEPKDLEGSKKWLSKQEVGRQVIL
jgi:hypothetical protein